MVRTTGSDHEMLALQEEDGFLAVALQNECAYWESGTSHQARSDVGVDIHKQIFGLTDSAKAKKNKKRDTVERKEGNGR
jgi:hypothetical protein